MTNIKTSPFDSADYLKDPEDVAAYLEAYLEDSRPEELSEALATIASGLNAGTRTLSAPHP